MFCQRCGAENIQNASYCIKCGAAIRPAPAGQLNSDDVLKSIRSSSSQNQLSSNSQVGSRTAAQSAAHPTEPVHRHWTVLFAVFQWSVLTLVFLIQAWAISLSGFEIGFAVSILLAFLSLIIAISFYKLERYALSLTAFTLVVWAIYNLFVDIPLILAAIYMGVTTSLASNHLKPVKGSTTTTTTKSTGSTFKNAPTYDRLVDQSLSLLLFPSLFKKYKGDVERDTAAHIEELGKAAIEVIYSVFNQEMTARSTNLDYMVTLIKRAGYAISPDLEHMISVIKKRSPA